MICVEDDSEEAYTMRANERRTTPFGVIAAVTSAYTGLTLYVCLLDNKAKHPQNIATKFMIGSYLVGFLTYVRCWLFEFDRTGSACLISGK